MQPNPKPGVENISELVLADVQDRVNVGLARYGTNLMSHNGRDSMQDLYEEELDKIMYLRQALVEWDRLREIAGKFAGLLIDGEFIDLCYSELDELRRMGITWGHQADEDLATVERMRAVQAEAFKVANEVGVVDELRAMGFEPDYYDAGSYHYYHTDSYSGNSLSFEVYLKENDIEKIRCCTPYGEDVFFGSVKTVAQVKKLVEALKGE